jgi:hypothetical protein
MISVILYGRNDSHGYNLHKRAAISINCIAEVLCDADDEVLFVDCNTPNDLPTFIEAIYDTLTPRAKSFLRVLRLRPRVYSRLVGQTHLLANEAHSRNIALRRSNPRNRWVLSTNTDMIFVTDRGFSNLPDAVRDLEDGHYVTPRYELPEPLWESFPRANPSEVMRLCEDLSPKLHLYEIASRVAYMRFDSPGDFQLMPRQALIDICGFDERMTHGWHADSNMCKRMYLFFGERTESLERRVRAYHCDHTRVATLAHHADLKLDNSLQEFVWDVKDPVARHQADSWGAPGEGIEELDFSHDPAARYVCALERTLAPPQEVPYYADCNDARNFVYYPHRHALPYLAANLTVYPRDARFAYVGNNPLMFDLIARSLEEMGFAEPLHDSRDLLIIQSPTTESLAKYNSVIFDFGLDPSGRNLSDVRRVTDWPRDLRYNLGAVARLMESCCQQFALLPRDQIPDFLLLNANHYIFQRFAGQLLLSTETPYPLHVRKGRPRIGDERRYRGSDWKYTEDELCSYFAYGETDLSIPAISPGHAIDFTSEGHSARYKDGHWGAMDYSGTWTDGYSASILFEPPTEIQHDLLAYVRVNEAFPGLDEGPVHLRVFLDSEFLTRWSVYTRYHLIVCKAQLPARLMAGKKQCRLELQIQNPQSPQKIAEARGERIINEDPRELGVKVQNVTFLDARRLNYSLGHTLEFTETSSGAEHSNECWSQPDNYGQWSLGQEARLVFLVDAQVHEPVRAVFNITDVAVNTERPRMELEVFINDEKGAAWTLGPERTADQRTILLREGLPAGRLVISFRIKEPCSPKQLGWSNWDTRPLGFRLTAFRLELAGNLKYRLGDVVDFTSTGNSAIATGDSLGVEWTQPDLFGSWTLGREASLRFVFEQPPTTPLLASFVISDCVVSEDAQTVVYVKANGRPAGEWKLNARGVYRRSLMLPAEAILGEPELILTFDVETPRSPESLGWSADSRPLGFRLARLSIGSEVPMPPFGKRTYIVRRLFQRALGLPAFAMHHARRVAKWWYER